MEKQLNIHQNKEISRRDFLKITIWTMLAWTLSATTAIAHINKQTQHIQIKEHIIPTSTLEKDISTKLKIALISDLHITPHNIETIRQAFQTLQNLKPDFVVLSWDIVEDMKTDPQLLHILDELKIPTIVNPWNHDYCPNWLNKSLVEYFQTHKQDFIFLRNKRYSNSFHWTQLNITWVWSFLANDLKIDPTKTPKKWLNIMASHEPIWTQIKGFQLYLCGHTHWANTTTLQLCKLFWAWKFNENDLKYNNWLYQLDKSFIVTSGWIWKSGWEIRISETIWFNFRVGVPTIDLISFC